MTAVQYLSKNLHDFSDDVGRVLRDIKGMAGDALAAYWPELERAQALADTALVKGREAQADLSSAKSRLPPPIPGWRRPASTTGSGRVTNEVEVVIRDGNIHTAYPI